MLTYNFKTQPYAYETPYKGEYRDLRSGFVCKDPTGDLQCYINYIDLLNEERQNWNNYAYLDFGLMPLVMLPTFLMHNSQIEDALVKMVRNLNVTCYSLPASSVMYKSVNLPKNDIWVEKAEIARVLNCDVHEASLSRLLRRVTRV